VLVAFSQLAIAHTEEALGLDDLELLAQAAYLCGEDASSEKAWTEANRRSVENEDWARAARSAFWLGVTLQARSERAQAGGWFARAQRVLEDNDHDCVERAASDRPNTTRRGRRSQTWSRSGVSLTMRLPTQTDAPAGSFDLGAG
jgi:hypothetical protein